MKLERLGRELVDPGTHKLTANGQGHAGA